VNTRLKRSFIPDTGGRKNLFLVLSSAGDIRQNNLEIIRELTTSGYHVIIVTTNQPYEVLRRIYEKNGVNLSLVFVIDAITNYALGNVPEEVTDAKFISSPSNLTDLGIALIGALSDMSDQRPYIVFDSVNTMLIYLSSTDISKFLHYITNKLRFLNTPGIFLAVAKGLNPMMLSHLTTAVDEIVEL
jgi:KaiC/GvpD/RAD55 family RecA-like ATPase